MISPSKRGQLSSELEVLHPSSTVLCPYGALGYKHVHLMLTSLFTPPRHTQTALLAQVQVCLASTPRSASFQHWPYVACIALLLKSEARSSPPAQQALTVFWNVVARALGRCREDTQSYSSALCPTPGSPQFSVLVFCGPQQPRSSVGLVKLACFLGQNVAVELTHG